MRKLATKILVTSVLVGLLCAAAPTGAATTSATVNVTITVLPYAEVILGKTTLNVTITSGQTSYGPVYVSGTVVCNCPVMLFARIKPPAGAPGAWSADTRVASIGSPGVYQFGQLLCVLVWDIPSDYQGGVFDLGVSGRSAPTISQVPIPDVGEVMVTVVPE